MLNCIFPSNHFKLFTQRVCDSPDSLEGKIGRASSNNLRYSCGRHAKASGKFSLTYLPDVHLILNRDLGRKNKRIDFVEFALPIVTRFPKFIDPCH